MANPKHNQQEREGVRQRLYRNMASSKGIGPRTADMCSRLAMDVLDCIIAESEVESEENPSPGDFPWSEIPAEYKWVAWDFNVNSSENKGRRLYAYKDKPEVTRKDASTITTWNGGDPPTLRIDDKVSIPESLIPNTPEEAGAWLFKRPE